MGRDGYSSVSYRAAVDTLRSTGSDFVRSKAAMSRGDFSDAAKSDILSPTKLVNGIRESCFAEGFNDATAIAIGIDGTGSMQVVPQFIQENLPLLLDMLVDRGVSDHPNVLFSVFDDEHATPPTGMFQMSQFETEAKKLVEALNEAVIPGRGGANRGEAYHLFFYALANHTKIECFDRDGEKGFAFLVCDEQPYYDSADPAKYGTNPKMAKLVFDDTIQDEISMLESVKKTVERYNVFVLRPHCTSNGKDMKISKQWQDLLLEAGENPQNVLDIPDNDAIIPTMALAIGRIAGLDTDEMVDVLKSGGASGIDGAVSAVRSLVPRTDTSVAVGSMSSDLVTCDTEVTGGRPR